MAQDLIILIPAAGSSSRMRGGDKLLEFVRGEAQLARIVKAALATGGRVVVTLGENHIAREMVLNPTERLDVVRVPDAQDGMSASLRKGAEWAGDAAAMMILPADLPELEKQDLQLVLQHFSRDPSRVIRATSESGTPGHPVILPARLVPALRKLRGDEGARTVLEGEDVTFVALPGERATTDLDTPEAWASWRAARGL